MKSDTHTDIDPEWMLDEAKPCETPIEPCDQPASVMVWSDHHVLGCPYTGYRCDMHFMLMLAQTRSGVAAMNSGVRMECSRCHARVTGGDISDHLRWIKL